MTRLDYFKRVSDFEATRRCEATGGCGGASRLYVLDEAFLYRASCLRGACDESHAENAIKTLRRMYDWRFCDPGLRATCNEAGCTPPLPDCDPKEKVGFEWMERPGIAYLWIRESPTFDRPGYESDRRRIRALLLDSARRFWPNREAGAMNRAMGGALTYLLVTKLFPGEPEDGQWKAYSDSVWREFWNAMDTEEDSAGYNDLWLHEVLEYASIAGLDTTLWNDPRFKSLVHRFYEHVAPVGIDASYGQSGWQGDSTGHIWLFEKAAAKYRDPTYKWMAHRIFDYNRTHACHLDAAHDTYQNDTTPLCWAYLDADDTVPEIMPRGGSVYTTRLEARPRPPSARGSPAQYFDLGRREVPDKLVLRSGYESGDLYAVFNLIAGEYGHGRPGPASLVSLMDRGSQILGQAGDPYWFFESLQDQDSSTALCKRYWGGQYAEPGDRTRVSLFTDYRRATVVWIDWENPHGWRVDQERRVYFVRNRFLLIRDRFHLPVPMKASIGTVWHAADVRSHANPADPNDPDHGTNWYDIYFRQPLANIFKFRNPERYALLYFVPRTGYEAAAFKEEAYEPAGCAETPPCLDVTGECRSSSPFVLYQRRITEGTREETDWFDTLILPHGRDLSPSGAAANVHVIHDDGTAVGLEVVIGDETWTVVDNPAGARIATPALNTDASYLIACSRPGASDYVMTKDATVVRTRTLQREWATKTSVETWK